MSNPTNYRYLSSLSPLSSVLTHVHLSFLRFSCDKDTPLRDATKYSMQRINSQFEALHLQNLLEKTTNTNRAQVIYVELFFARVNIKLTALHLLGKWCTLRCSSGLRKCFQYLNLNQISSMYFG